MKEELEKIRNYTRSHPELMAAHHFLFDLPLADGVTNPDYVVMGINPGEAKDSDGQSSELLREETREVDFHALEGRPRADLRWSKMCKRFLGTSAIVQTEMFFWSSRNMTHFEERFGKMLFSPHLGFCTEMNKKLLSVRKPKAVVFPGLSMLTIGVYEYGLKHIKTVRSQADNDRLIEVLTDGKRPWLFTKHWSGARYFTSEKRSEVSSYIEQVRQASK